MNHLMCDFNDNARLYWAAVLRKQEFVEVIMCEIKRDKEVNRELQIKTMNGKYSGGNNRNRSILTIQWDSVNLKTAIAIGINPSKANNTRSDKTLTTLARFLDAYGYYKFEMLNLFENYSTNQNGIDKKAKTDFSKYKSYFKKADSIFIAWGVAKNYQKEKRVALTVLKSHYSKLLCIQNGNGSKPIHPSRMNYTDKVVKYKI